MGRRKLYPRESLGKILGALRRKGRRIVFTNGCFDILHVGHVRYLSKARSLGDLLVVAINTDRSVRRNKGPGRPVNSQHARAEVLSALECVDYVTFFGEETPLKTIIFLKPNVLVKGSDWGRNEIVGRREVEMSGGRVVRVRLARGYSTTSIIKKMRKKPDPA
jgi:rfaE bifunctional protein nucleotidyltransferase chain/domain